MEPTPANATETRIETDSLGEVAVPAWSYWGAQTQRSLDYLAIGRDRYVWGRPVIEALGVVKEAAATANLELGRLPQDLATLIIAAAREVASGQLDAHFPLVVFQTGSGTHTNMNANEVIANRANELAGRERGSKSPIHPNDHVNMSQSSNDVFPTVMHLTTVRLLHRHLYPALDELRDALADRAQRFAGIVKVGRTHLQDAAPITMGQEVGGWIAQLDYCVTELRHAERSLLGLAIGATAVGTGLNSPAAFGPRVAALLARVTGVEFTTAPDRFAALSAHDAMVNASATLRTLAGALMKIANDVRWLASGPRAGIGELMLPANEPGSSIMPGKVNPTQCEALTMVATQVFGHDAAVAFAGSQGNFQLNVYKPVMLHNVLDSITLLGDACRSFARFCAAGIEPHTDRIASHLASDLMLVTALAPHIGYERAAAIAHLAEHENLTLRDAALRSGVSDHDFDAWVVPADMTHPTD